MRIRLKIDIKKISKELKAWLCRLPCFLAQRAFWVFAIVFTMEILFSFAVFYYYSFSREDIGEESAGFSQEKESIEQVVQEILKRRAQAEREYFELFEAPQKVD